MIIVTGGTGLVGGHLLMELLNQDQPVRALIREGGNPEKVLHIWKYYHSNPFELLSRIEWIETDLSDKMAVASALDKKSQVYHCAGQVSFQKKQRKNIYENNLLLTRNILNVCIEKNIDKYIHVSSIATIGDGEDIEFELNETSPFSIRKKKSYSDSKIQAELEVWRAMAEGLNALIVNPSIILGPANWNSGSSRIFDAVYKGLKFYTNGVSGYVDARDVARGMVKLMNSNISGERFILNAANLSFKDLFQKIARTLGVSPPTHCIGPTLTSLAWLVEAIRSGVSGKEAKITKQSAQSAHKVSNYSSAKIIKQLEFEFMDIDLSIKQIAKFYLSHLHEK